MQGEVRPEAGRLLETYARSVRAAAEHGLGPATHDALRLADMLDFGSRQLSDGVVSASSADAALTDAHLASMALTSDRAAPDFETLVRVTIDRSARSCQLAGFGDPLRGPASAAQGGTNSAMKRLSTDYGMDAKADDARARWILAVSSLLGLGILALLVVGLVIATKADQDREIFWFYVAAAGTIAIPFVSFIWLGNRVRRASSENRRLEHQIAGLDEYIEPLPDETKALIRATMIQRLFPRLLDDADPLRDPVFPTPAEVLLSLGIGPDSRDEQAGDG